MNSVDRLLLSVSVFCLVALPAGSSEANRPEPASTEEPSEPTAYEYHVLATSKTSTMEKELNEAADAGYRFRNVMGGETSFGGSEVVVVMSKDPASAGEPRFRYKLLATGKTSTMQKELQEAGDAGFEAVGQTVFSSTFGGDETVIIVERDDENPARSYEYKLLATKKTGTLQKELLESGEAGFDLVGLTVSKTRFGGTELVSVMRRKRTE